MPRAHIAAAALAALLPLLVFGPSVATHHFVSLDDTLLITRNAAVHELTVRSVRHIFTSYDPELYVPLTLLSYQVEHALWGLVPAVYHASNLVLHIASTVMLFFLFSRLFRARWIALFCALLFALHPLQSEAVLWAAARKDVLSTFFFVLSLLIYETTRHDRRGRWWSVGAFFLGLLSKVTVATLPFVLLLLDCWQGRPISRKSVISKWPYFLLSAIFIVIALFGKRQNVATLGLISTFLLACKSTIFFLEKFLWPSSLSVLYPQETPVTITSAEFALPVAAVILLLCVVAFLWMRWRPGAIGLLFFLLTLAPGFANFWKNNYLFFASDRYVYIPIIGLLLALGAALDHLLHSPFPATIRARALPAVAAGLVIASSIATAVHADVWRDSRSLYHQTLALYPREGVALNNLGYILLSDGETEEGLALLHRAVAADPNHVQPRINIAQHYEKAGDMARAEEWFHKAVAALPPVPSAEDLGACYLLGVFLIDAGKIDEGLAALRLATEHAPHLSEPFLNLGLQLQKAGRIDEALAAFEHAIALNDRDIASRYHLAGIYAERGRLPEAREQLEKVTALDAGYEKAAEHLRAIRGLMGE